VATSSATQSQDAGAELTQQLRDEGWTDEDFRMLMHPESTVLRNMAHTNVKSRVAIEKTRR
jgi:hypothetical protein